MLCSAGAPWQCRSARAAAAVPAPAAPPARETHRRPARIPVDQLLFILGILGISAWPHASSRAFLWESGGRDAERAGQTCPRWAAGGGRRGEHGAMRGRAGAPFLPAHPGGGSQTLGRLLLKKSGPCFRQMFSGRAASPGVSGPQATWGGELQPPRLPFGVLCPCVGRLWGSGLGGQREGRERSRRSMRCVSPRAPALPCPAAAGDCSTPRLLNFLRSPPFPLSRPFPPC